MKKFLSLFLTLILAVSLFAACGENNANNNNNAQDTSKPTQSATPTDSAADNPEDNDTSNDVQEGIDKVKDSAKDLKDNMVGDTQNSLPEISENKDVVKEKNAPKIYMIEGAESNTDSITYHLEGCKACEGKQVTEIPWEMAQMIGFWQCPECNPPRYEGYKNAK